jgi:PAS domain S-box-containing protein
VRTEVNSSDPANAALLSNPELTLFPGDSELAARMRALDWSQTPLGAVETWPQSLRISVSICLTSRFPILIWWGRELVMLYNDAYRPILGISKHPQALGQRGQECWAEIWETIGPMLDSVMTQGEATWSDDGLLLLDRNGYVEECYFTFSYSPILNEMGGIGGIFTAVTETTERVLSKRRLRTLSELAAKTTGLTTVAEVCTASTAVLAENLADIPFALLYLLDPAQQQASLAAATGIPLGTELSPLKVNCAIAKADLSQCFCQGLQTRQPQRIDIANWSTQSNKGLIALTTEIAMVMPVNRSGQEQLAGFWVVGVNPRRALDENYQNFFELVAGHIATAIANAQAYEEERKRAEALAEINRAKTTFFGNVSHEFRTPLTLMLSPLEELSTSLEQRLQPDEREQLQLIQRNGLRLQKLVNTLLDFSRIEAGRAQVCYEPIDLATYTAELASLFRSLIEQVGIDFAIDCPPLSEPVYVDREMWEKIVFNLISNAFKFTFAGSITVRLRSQDNAVELSIQDTGVGIPAAELPQLFKRFHRVHGMRARTYEGSGIGLALVQELVKLHQGTIDVTSVEGAGTCFRLSIPTGIAHLPSDRINARRTLASTALGANPYLEEASSWLSPERFEGSGLSALTSDASIQPSTFNAQVAQTAHILLADDNADMRDYVGRLLRHQYTVEAVPHGEAALSAIRQSAACQQMPDLVLTDVMMPHLDGLGLLQALRTDPLTQEIPVILLSARAGEEARIEGLAAGADDYLTKPFSTRELLARVEATLKLARLRRDTMQREQALRRDAEAAQQQVETVLSSIQDGFYVLDRDWRFTYVNDRYCEMVSMQRSALLGQSVWELFPAAIGTEAAVQFHRAMDEQTPVQFDYLYAPWNCWHDHRIYPSPSGLSVFLADITDRKRTELMLAEQTRLLEMIAAGQPLDDCLAAVCESVSSLSPSTRVCILLADDRRSKFARSVTPGFPPSLSLGLKDAPINELAIGTCGTAVYSGQPVTCVEIAKDDHWSQAWRDLCIMHSILACYSAPVIGRNDLPLGSLMLCFNEARLPTDWEKQLAEFGTQVVSIALERDRSSCDLRESEERLNLAVEGSGMATWDADLHTGKAIWSPNHFYLLGYDPATSGEPTVEMCLGRVHPDDLVEVMQTWEIAQQERSLYRIEHRFVRADTGRVVWVAATGRFLTNSAEETVRFVGVMFDISDRKQAEAKLKETLTLLNAISDYSLDIIFAKDRAGRLLFINPAISRHFGKSVAELLGKDEFFFIEDQAAAEAIRANDQRIMRSGVAEILEEPILIDGHLRTFLSTKAPLRDANDNILGIIGIGHDITERKQAEADLEERNNALDSFVHIVSHDLKAPLRAISNLSQWLEDDLENQLPPENQQQLQLLRARVARMESMINSLLLYARVGRQETPLETFNVAELLSEIIDSLAPPEGFSINIEQPMPTLTTKRLFLSQVFTNLISNAIKHHTSVEGHLDIRGVEQQNFYEFMVRDDGPGIAPEHHAKIFTIFQTLKAEDNNSDSTGVGLAIVKKIIEMEEGTIRVESCIGNGTTFFFTWPKRHS